MALRLRNILTTALLFGIGGETAKAKADDFSAPAIKKFNFDQKDVFVNPFNLKKEEQKNIFWQTDWQSQHNPLPTNDFYKDYPINNLDYSNSLRERKPYYEEDFITKLSRNPLTPISSIGLIILGIYLFKRSKTSKQDSFLTSKDIKNILEKAFPEKEPDMSDIKNSRTNNIFLSRNLTPYEQSNLNLVLRIISYSNKLDDLIHDQNISIYFKKSRDLTQDLDKKHPVLLELKNANYPPWEHKEELKLESYALVEKSSTEENDKAAYNIFITDYHNVINLTASVLRELNRVFLHQNKYENNSTLAESQLQCLENENDTLQEIYKLLCKDSSNDPVGNLIYKKLEEEEKQYNSWKAAYERYLAEVNSSLLSPYIKPFLK